MLKTFLLALCCAGCVFTLIPQDSPQLEPTRIPIPTRFMPQLRTGGPPIQERGRRQSD